MRRERLTGNDINWNQVFYFSEVAGCGSFKDAGERLGLSPSTLSEHIAQLEKDLDVLLFHRQHRKIVLTAEGSRLYQHAKEMFEVGRRMADVISPLSLGAYPISVGLVPSPSIQTAYGLIGDLLKKAGPLSLKVLHSKHEELEQGLAKAKYDFGFSSRPAERHDLDCRLIVSSSVRFFVADRWSETDFPDLLERIPLLICNSEPSSRTLVEQALRDADLVPENVIVSDYPSVLIDLCQRGLGIGAFAEAPMAQLTQDTLTPLRTPRSAPKLKEELFVLWAKAASNTEAVKRLRGVIDA